MNDIILLAFPGLVAVTVYRWFSRSRSRAGWDYLVLTGLAGAAAYVLVHWARESLCALDELRLILETGRNPLHCFTAARPPGLSGGPAGLETSTYFAAFPMAAVLGYTTASWLHSGQFRRLSKRVGMRHSPGEEDALTALARLTSPVIVSTDTEQLYVGLIRKVTTDPDEELKLVALEVSASGARDHVDDQEPYGTSKFVRHRARYHYALPFDASRSKHLFLDFRNIVGIGEFHVSDFLETIASGYTEIDGPALNVLLQSIVDAGADVDGDAEEFLASMEEQPDG